MLSFWPSFSLLVFFLVILLECRAIAGRVTLPLGGFLMVFCYGAIGAPLLALLLQQILPPLDASAESMRLMAWLIAPPIEEIAKALPVILLAFLAREARRLSIADLTLIGFASGAGFGFIEGNLNALVNGTLPGFASLAALGLETGNGGVFFAGHAVATALVGLAAGIGLRFLPLKVVYAWAPSAFVILWASFDHGLYNWKLLNADSTGALPNAHFITELLHIAALKGQLATWLLPLGLIIAQFFEAHLCSKAVGARRDLLLAREWRPWVVNEWFVALLRAPLGRAAFGQTLAYFRLRRAFYLASFEARRDPGDPTWTRHARALEERLKRERSILFDPPPGTWLLPFPVLKTYAAEWAWRMRWVLLFAVLFVFLFLLGPRSLPDGLRQVLYGQTFAIAMVAAALAFAVWRIILFVRQPRPDPLAAEGAAYAGYYTRALLLGCSFVCGVFPAAALLLGWKAFAPGAAFLSGYLPGWTAQGGNLQTLLGLGAVGSAVAPDPRPTGEAYRHEIAAADARLRLLAADIEDTTGAAETASPGSRRPIQLEAFLGAMAKLDAERDAQARRQLVLDECERHAGEATIADPAPAAQAVKDEFDRLANQLLDAAAKELDAIAAIEQAYGRAWAEIMQDLDAHDVLRRRLRVPLRAAWQAQDDIGWALRVVEATDEGLLPMQLTLLSELHAVATSAQSARADMVTAGIERIRETAAQYGEEDPFAFAGAEQANDDEAALLAEFASSEPPAEAPKPFGLRTPQPAEPPAARADDLTPEPEPQQPAENRVQKALDQLIGSTESDERYLETIRHLERSAEALRHPLAPAESRSTAPVADKLAGTSDRAEPQGELEDLIDAIKRDSGYLDFKDTHAGQSDERDAFDIETPAADEDDATDEPIVASAPAEPADEGIEREGAIPEPAPEPIVASRLETPDVDLGQTADDALALEIEEPVTVDETVDEATPAESASAPAPEPSVASLPETPAIDFAQTADGTPALKAEAQAEVHESVADAALLEPAGLGEPDELLAALATEAAPADEPAQTLGETLAHDAPIAAEPVPVATPIEPVEERTEPAEAAAAPMPEPAVSGDESVQDEAKGEPFVLVAEDEPAGDVKETQPAAAPVTLQQSEQLALPLAPEPPEARREEERAAETLQPRRTQELTPRRETSERIDAEESAPVERQRPAIEPARAREPDEPASKAEIRSSLFTRLFQSIKRQSAEPAKRARRDEPKPVDTKPAQSVVASRIEDQPAALQPRTPSAEITVPKTEWLADFTATKPEAGPAQVDDTPLEPIEWPTLSRTVDVGHSTQDAAAERIAPVETPAVDHHAQAQDAGPAEIGQAEVVAPAIDAEHLESKAPADDVFVFSTLDKTEADAAAVTIDAVNPVEPEAPAINAADSSAAEQIVVTEPTVTAADEPAQPETASVAAEVTNTEVEKPQGADEFGSKADRLSYLLAKLEQAVQAKVAASSTPNEAPVAVTPTASSTPTEFVADSVPRSETSDAPSAVEPKFEAPQLLLEPTPQLSADEAPTEPAETSVVPEQSAIADPQPAADKPSPAIASSEPQKPTDAQLKPDRLSYILDRLFETAKREPAERPGVPQQADPEPSPVPEMSPVESAAYPPESDILDLRGPHPLPEPPDEEAPSSAGSPPPPPESKTEEPVHAAATPIDTSVVVEPLQPAQSELQPLAKTQDVTPAPTSTQSGDQPAAPSSRPRRAEPATHFGSRSKPPRPKSPTRARDAEPAASAPEKISQSVAPQRPAADVASADTETPATTPKRDWKLARSEPSKPVDAPPAESAKKPDIRIKTGSGALATTDAAPINSPAATAHTPGKYYGPRLAKAEDDGANSPAQQRALGLADALTEYYAKTGEPQPPMHTTDRATLQRIVSNGKLEAPKRRGAAWSTSGMSRRGEVAIRLKPGAEQFIEFVPSNEIFGQMAHYYPRGVGKGSFATHIPAGHLEYFDVSVHQWVPLLRGRE